MADIEATRKRKREWARKNRKMNLQQRKEYEREASRKRRAKDPEKVRAYHRAYQVKWRAENKDRIAAYFQKYFSSDNYKANIEKRRRRLWKLLGMPEPTRPCPDVCECCGRPQVEKKGSLDLDHCHVTGAFRGWLCGNCNRGIGLLGDSLDGARRAFEYMSRAYGPPQ